MNDIGPMGQDMGAAAGEYREEVDGCVRRHPEGAILTALLGGILVGLVIMLLRPQPTPRSRAARMLSDIRNQVRGLTRPMLKRTGELAALSAKRMTKQARASEKSVERTVRELGSRWGRLFS